MHERGERRCTHSPASIALLRVLGAPDAVRFHRVSDWATNDHPEIAEPLHECDEIAIKASEVLVGKSRIVAMQLVMASAAHLLSLVDERSGHGTAQKTRRALAVERKELTQTRKYFHQAANGEAQIVYVFGMTLGIAGLGLLAALLEVFVGFGGIDGRELFGCLIAGGLGALVSVMSRISAGRFHLASDFGAKYPLFLGVLRPLIGSIFGLDHLLRARWWARQDLQPPEARDRTDGRQRPSLLLRGHGVPRRLQ